MSATENIAGAVCPGILSSSLELFRGFPYLNTRISPAFYHIMVLPADREAPALHELGIGQQAANRLKSCLVLGEAACIYYDHGSGATLSDSPPRGGRIVFDRLRSAVSLAASEELTRRQLLLRQFAARLNRDGGYLMGDLTKGGHPASAEELERLAGSQANGVPRGLGQCGSCGLRRGECLDPASQFQGQVISSWPGNIWSGRMGVNSTSICEREANRAACRL